MGALRVRDNYSIMVALGYAGRMAARIGENAMSFQRVPRTCEIVLVGERAGQEIINTFYAQHETDYTLANLVALANAVDTWAGTEWLTEMPADYNYVRTDVRGLNAAIDLSATADAHAGNGALANSGFSNNSSLAVSRRSGFTGRGARGRVYIPPPSSAALADDNHVTADFEAAIVAVLDLMDEAVDGAGFIPVIVHRVASGVPLAEAVVFTLVEWVVVDRVIDSMRRRLPGRGV